MMLYIPEAVKFVEFPHVLDKDQFERVNERLLESDFVPNCQFILFTNGILREKCNEKIDWDSYALDMYNEVVHGLPVPLKNYFKDH